MQRAERFAILRRKPVPGYTISFLITNIHTEGTIVQFNKPKISHRYVQEQTRGFYYPVHGRSRQRSLRSQARC
jgi:hypothetical protein